ncbi:O-antigen ligase family protein [Gordonia sp. NPDC003425]
MAIQVSHRRSTLGFTQFVDMTTVCSRGAILALICAAFSTTWGVMHVSVIQIADIFLLLAVGSVGLMTVFGGLRYHVPWWVWTPTLTLLICGLTRTIAPIPDYYFADRYSLPEGVPGDHTKIAIWLLAVLAIPLCVVACSAIDTRVPEWVAISYLAGSCVSSIVALSDLSGLTAISGSFGYTNITLRQTGLTAHPNTLAFVAIVSIPIASYLLGSNSRSKQYLAAVALAILAGGIAVSGSRGAQALFIPVVIASILVQPRTRRAAVAKGFAVAAFASAVAGGLLLAFVLPDSAVSDLFRFGDDNVGAVGSDTQRTELADQGLNDFFQHPFAGIGIKHIADAHNIYLQIISAGGLVLLAGMISFWLGCLSDGWKLTRSGVALAPFLAISVCCWLILGMVENPITDRYLYYTVACIAGLASTQRNKQIAALVRGGNRTRQPLNPGTRVTKV